MDIKFIKGIGEKRAEAFKKIGIDKVDDFLKFIPRLYLKKISIKEIFRYFGENVVITGKLTDIDYPMGKNRPLTVFITDKTGTTCIPVFGRSEFRSRQFRLNEKYIFWGKVGEGFKFSRYQLDYRDHLKIAESTDNEFSNINLIPIYELQGVLKKTFIRPLLLSKIVYNALKTIDKQMPGLFNDTLSEEILKHGNFISRREAIFKINFPEYHSDIETARKRLAFEELFFLELILALKKQSIKTEKKLVSFKKNINELTNNFKKCLDFELTNAQKKVINEIYKDMKSDRVMNRLLQGDVGSGKTIVAIFSILIAIENGYQSAFMCPTEILAEQHYRTLMYYIDKYNSVSGKDIKISLLIGGQKKKIREQILQDIRSGKSNIIIGTHALIQETVEYNNLGFVVIDEQHKFGVMQRAKLKDKGLNPDVLVMTATPIPRTLALTYYGDLDVSVIDEIPGSRKKVITALRKEEDKKKIFDFVKSELKKGRQTYIIYPIIEESEKTDLKSAEENYKFLKEKVFKEFSVGMVHGRLFWYEKDDEMKAFKEKKINVLVSTTVIEVGIDIPNATIMIIEDAQRFGLSQLHQLRGRVGRGAEQSYCILIAKNLDEISEKRLKTLCKSNNGFEIAEKDMEIRGPGEFFGIRQSGILNFSCTDLTRDKEILISARNIAFKIVEDDPNLRKKQNIIIRESFLKNYKDALYLMKIA